MDVPRLGHLGDVGPQVDDEYLYRVIDALDASPKPTILVLQQKFPPELAAQYRVLHFAYEWQFTGGRAGRGTLSTLP